MKALPYGRRTGLWLAVAVAALASTLTSCGSSTASIGAQGSSSATAPAVTAAGTGYSSTTFVVPFDVAPPAWLKPMPTVTQPNFITWEAPPAPPVRFLVPVRVYQPGSKDPVAPPQDYFTYLSGQTNSGAHLTEQRTMTIGGRPATVVTATTDKSLDGSLGCPTPTTAAPDCFGLQPDVVLRIAVVNMGDKTLLAWLKVDKNTPASQMASEIKAFEAMLASIRFPDRRVTPAATPTSQSATSAASRVATPIDGVWTASWTYQELAASPLNDGTETNDQNWGRTTLTLKGGQATEATTNSRWSGSDRFAYSLQGNKVTFDRGNGEQFVMRWNLTGNQLRFIRDDTLGVGPTPYVIKPFSRR